MALVGCTSLFGLVWVIGGIVTIFGAVCYAELVASMPKSGGPYVYLKEAYGSMWAFLRGWAMFFVSETAAIAAVALVFAEFTAALIQIITGEMLPNRHIILIALSLIWLFTIVSLYGIALSGKIQTTLSFFKVLAVGAIIGIAFCSQGGNPANFVTPVLPETFGFATILAVGAALRFSFFAFSGWEGATYIAEEVKNPQRNLPLSLFLGIGGVMLLYAGVNSAYIYLLPPAEMAASRQVASDAMRVAIGASGGALIAGAVMLSTFGNVSTQILCKARSWQAMARDGLFFKKIAELHPKYKTPNNSLIAQGLWATVLLLFASLYKNSYEVIIAFFSATSTIFNIMTFAAVFILRKKFPDIERPYKAWLYPYSLIGILMIYTAFLILTLITAPLPSLIGILLTFTGLIYYYREKILNFRLR
jgi:amino acid transporter